MSMDDDFLAQLEADAEEVAAAAPVADLSKIAELAHELIRRQNIVAGLTEELKLASKLVLDLETKTLPEAMDAAQMKEFTTVEGFKIAVAPVVSASITGPKKPVVCTWLRKEGHDELIKPTITVTYGKGSLETAQEQAAKLSEELQGTASVSVEEDVNTASFKALINELRGDPEQAAKIPYEELGIYVGRKATVAVPKPKKAKK